MGLTRSYLVSLLLYISVVTEIRLPQVRCQDEENSQCIPKRAFLALLRLPEVNSNLAAYSRTARVIQGVNNRNDMAHLKALTEESDDTEICIPSAIYLELFRDPALRGHLSVIGRTQKLPEFPGRLFEDSEEVDPSELLAGSQKRSIATLAKNDDLPISIQDRVENEDDEEKRSIVSSSQPRRTAPELLEEYLLRNGDFDLEALARDYYVEKRNVGSLARDFALPPARGNGASTLRDYGLHGTKRNIGTLARDRMLPPGGKRNVASLAKSYTLPQAGKRNVAALARDYGLPYGKRYLGSLARASGFPPRDGDKRTVASLARNADWPGSSKRAVSGAGSLILRTLSRHGRSSADSLTSRNDPLDLQKLAGQQQDDGNTPETRTFDVKATLFGGEEDEDDFQASTRRVDDGRFKKQIDYSDEYPLPVMQNANLLDYEGMMEANRLTGQYANAEKRFMGIDSATEVRPDTFHASKRHIAALARLGWLPSLRSARFSRSPRYVLGREDSADGPSSNYSSNTATRSLRRNFNPRTRYVQALHGDCRHGFKRFALLPAVDDFLIQKLASSPRSM